MSLPPLPLWKTYSTSEDRIIYFSYQYEWTDELRRGDFSVNGLKIPIKIGDVKWFLRFIGEKAMFWSCFLNFNGTSYEFRVYKGKEK